MRQALNKGEFRAYVEGNRCNKSCIGRSDAATHGATMAVDVENPRELYSGNGQTTVFPLNFSYTDPDDVDAYIDDVLQTTGFTVSGNKVTFSSAPKIGAEIALVRNTPLDQPVPFSDPQKTTVNEVERVHDRVVRQLQELALEINSSIRFGSSDGEGGLLASADERALKLIRFDENGAIELVRELGNWQDQVWAPGRNYLKYDIFKASNDNVYFVVQPHTSTSLAADEASGKIALLVDVAAAYQAVTDATNQADKATAQAQLAAASAAAAAASEAAVGATVIDNAVAAAQAAQAAVESIYDNFDDRYLGFFASDPTLDNDGNPLADGAIYWNTTINSLKFYDLGNSAWVDPLSDTRKLKDEAQVARDEAVAATANKADKDLGNADNGSVTLALLASEVTALLGTGFNAALGQGDWNPKTNTPTIPRAGTAGRWYRVSTAGTASGTNADGTYELNDVVVDNGTAWVLFRFPTVNIPNGYISFVMLAASVQKLIGETFDFGSGWLYAIRDTNQFLITGIKEDGAVFIHKLDSPTVDLINARIDQREIDTASAEALADQIDPAGDVMNLLEVVKDTNEKVLAYVRQSDGAYYIHKLESPTLQAMLDDIATFGQSVDGAVADVATLNQSVSGVVADVATLETRVSQIELGHSNPADAIFHPPLQVFVDSNNNIVRVNPDESENVLTNDSIPANPVDAKQNLLGRQTAVTFIENKRQQRLGLNGKGKRRVYVPADLNHIIAFGQSNSVGFNGKQGAPINTTQPFNNLMFDAITFRRHYNSGAPANSSDDSVLTFEEVSGSGLRAPWSLVLNVKDQGDRTVFWGPGSKKTSHWDHDYYESQLANVGFKPLVEAYEPSVDPKHSEGIITSICNELTAKTGHRFLGSVCGIGSMTIDILSAIYKGPGTSADGYPYNRTVDCSKFGTSLDGWWASGGFANVLAQVKRAKELCDARGWSYKVAAIPWIQGESDNGNTAYASRLAVLANALNATIKAITKQPEDIVLFVDGITYNGSFGGQSELLVVDQEQLIAHENSDTIDNNGRVYMTGPRYQYDTPVHYDSQSFVSKGTVYAEAINKVVFQSEEWEPLRYKSHSVIGNDIYVKFHVPAPPINFDIPKANSVSKTVTKSNANHGFRVLSSGQSNIITYAEVISGDTIKLTCSASPSGGTIEYAQQVGSSATIRGDVCDSFICETVVKDDSLENYETRNWAIPFTINL